MAYKVGVSSGFWYIGRDPSLLGLAQKTGFVATSGVTINQVDLETISEFLEPRVKENIKRAKKELGIQIGIHAEIGHLSALESADRRTWDEAHKRLIQTVKNAADIGIIYINFHLSNTGFVQYNEAQTRLQGYFYPVVTHEGKPFSTLADRSKAVKNEVLKFTMQGIARVIQDEKSYQDMFEKEQAKYEKIREKRTAEELRRLEQDENFRKLPDPMKAYEKRKIADQIKKEEYDELKEAVNAPEFYYQAWKKSPFAQYILNAGEISAYTLVAHYMKESGDTLWTQIAKNKDPEDAYVNNEAAFNAAVAAKYIEGHITIKDNKHNKDMLEGKSVLEWAAKNNIILAFEMPEVEQVAPEGMYRFFDPRHAYWLAKKMDSPFFKLCIDFEHMLAQHLDPYKVIPDLPGDAGKYMYLFHLGEPKPYQGKAHIPIPLGSQAQEIIYEWLYMLKQKGFKDGILIFERGSGRGGGKSNFEVFEQSVMALRHIADSLTENIKPDELPLEFYGLSEANKPEIARQRVSIREHALDPLEGVLSIPEEKHTFLSAAAVQKQKGPEWEKRKYR